MKNHNFLMSFRVTRTSLKKVEISKLFVKNLLFWKSIKKFLSSEWQMKILQIANYKLSETSFWKFEEKKVIHHNFLSYWIFDKYFCLFNPKFLTI
jgi:hypothetical protein